MNEKNYKYDAFISYRHTELDQFVAEKVQKYLEEFKLPKNVKGKKGLKKTKIERVFRDKEELTITNNLEDPIIQALKGSEYLIVICSPRIKESVWCRKEIEKFIEFHGRHKILTVLIEGEPGESFPEELLYEEEMVKENGIETIHRKDVEPLAADIRAKSKRRICSLLKTELLRVIAPMFGVEYDDLRQRHRERRLKRVLTATVAAAGLGILVGLAGIASALVINNQKAKISTQNEKLLQYQADSLANKAFDYLEQDRRIDAISTALSSVTSYEGIEMPYTAKGRFALTQALRLYDIGGVNKAYNQLITQSNIEDMKTSPSKKYVSAIDKTENLYVWDAETGKLVMQVDDVINGVYFDCDVTFVGDSMLAYINNEEKIVVKNLENNENKMVLEIDCDSIQGDANGKYLAVNGDESLDVYDVEKGEIAYQKELQEDVSIDSNIVWYDKILFFIEADDENRTLNMVDVESGKVIENTVEFNEVERAVGISGYLYLVGGNYGSREAEEYGVVLCIEEKSGKIIWDNKYNGRVISKIDVAEKSGEICVACGFSFEIICLDGKNGDVYSEISEPDGIADFFIDNDGNGYVLDIKAQLVSVRIFENEMYGIEYLFECNVDRMTALEICDMGFLVLPTSSNYIIKYEKVNNTDAETYVADDAILSVLEELDGEYVDYTDEAAQMGVANPDLVDRIIHINEKIAVVGYLDMTMDIYDVANKRVINSFTDVSGIPNKYLGTDSEGNIYIAGESCGYCFDKDYNMIADIPYLKYVDSDNGYLVIGYDEDKLWKYPIYSLDDLIEIAEEC